MVLKYRMVGLYVMVRLQMTYKPQTYQVSSQQVGNRVMRIIILSVILVAKRRLLWLLRKYHLTFTTLQMPTLSKLIRIWWELMVLNGLVITCLVVIKLIEIILMYVYGTMILELQVEVNHTKIDHHIMYQHTL